MLCRLCDSDRVLSVLDLGVTPPCEKFLTAEELDQPELTFPLHLRLCEDCLLLQIPALITPEDTFTEYAYFASYSDSWVRHAKDFVDHTIQRLGLGPHSHVVEVASNDGYLLQHVVAAGVPCLGIEPSGNVGAAIKKRVSAADKTFRFASGSYFWMRVSRVCLSIPLSNSASGASMSSSGCGWLVLVDSTGGWRSPPNGMPSTGSRGSSRRS